MYRFINVVAFRYILMLPVLLTIVSAAFLAATTVDVGALTFGVAYDTLWLVLKGAALFFLIDAWVLLYKTGNKFSYFAGVAVLGTFLSLAFGDNALFDLPTFAGLDTDIYKWTLAVAMLVLSIKINQQVR